MFNTIAITKPMILIPVDEYEQLLREAGEKTLPKLAREIKKAQEEFRRKPYPNL